MHAPRRIHLLTYVVAAAATIQVAFAFNIDTKDPYVYTGKPNDFFGYKVLQFTSGGNKGIIVTAPLQLNGSGGICRLDQGNTTCFRPNEISLPNATVKHLGLSIAADSAGSFTACSPSVAHECHENSYLNSICFNITNQMEQRSNFTPAFQECTKKTVDLVFLFDGSASMKEEEFNKNKVFIKDIMNSLKNTSIKFAAVQFSSTYKMVFDFNDYENGSALEKLDKEEHLRQLTNTHRALLFVLTDLFENPKAGASPDATKVLVIITDGDPSDEDTKGTVEKYNEKNIIRFVIAVKQAELDKFTAIASQPTQTYAFKIENYNGLKGVLETFQLKIFNMEGTKVALASHDMTDEMSQSGFSAVFFKDTLILGSVGSNSWRGALQERHEQKEIQIQDPKMVMDSYMGYSVSVGERNGVGLYFAGAPRFNHTGKVVLFRHEGKNWTAADGINGNQIGSYFGAELCSVDVDSDGNMDFLLVGSPMFYLHQEKTEGQIYVYALTNELQLKSVLNVTVPSMGRFGTTISSLADLNGDGLRDVAVGAPLEDDNRGAVYIYHGNKRSGICSTFNQRIMGENIKPGMRFFGQAIDGNIDLGEDGLPDIVVGSQGTAVILRSRPIFNVVAHLYFQPEQISTDNLDCVGTDENLPMVNLTACFEMVETTKSKRGAARAGLNISHTLEVDPKRQAFRGLFTPTDKKARNHTSTYELLDPKTCFSYPIYIRKCVRDTLSPISIKLSFFQADSENATAILNMDSKKTSVVEIPFEKQCRQNDTCIAELELDFNFTTPTLLVSEDNYFNVSIELVNHGDDSYNTSIAMHYPTGFSFSRMTVVKTKRPTLHSCNGLAEVLDKTTCGISLPVYRSGSYATFTASFLIVKDYEWNDTMSMTIAGTSDNTNSTRTLSMTKTIPVQYEIKMALTVGPDTIKYLNFTTEDDAPKKMVIMYRVDNIGFKDFPINVSLVFPTKLEHNFEMSNYQVFVQENKTQCRSSPGPNHCLAGNACVAVLCDGFNLEKHVGVEFTLTGDVQFRDLKQQAGNIAFLKRYTGDSAEIKFKSALLVDYDKKRYVLDSYKEENKHDFTREKSLQTGLWMDDDPTMTWTEARVEFIILPDQLLIILTGAGLGLLLLVIITVIMFKLGCFKRKTVDYYLEQEEKASLQACTFAESALVPTNGAIVKSEADDESEPPEVKKLLDDGEANGSPPAVDAEDGLE
ncbi:integrin alpha-X-like [Embiotoca jacksoni]|uniref:integrin alpha-X-like n=1 Tax=Embiotoca jacksoni TaxID=100190 RepID=UPI0037042273